MKVLKSCIENKDFDVPDGKYYLVDSGYTNTEKFLAPYRGGRYHLGTFNENTHVGRYRNAKYIFNHRHAQLRNCVEKSFGILKKRFRILRTPILYPFKIQKYIVIACCIIHNFIRRYQGDDKYFNMTIHCQPQQLRADDLMPSMPANNDERIRGEHLRDNIASRIWEDYRQHNRYQSQEI